MRIYEDVGIVPNPSEKMEIYDVINLLLIRLAISHNELALPTLSVAESRRDVSVGTLSCLGKKRDGGQCGFSPSKGERSESRSVAVRRSYTTETVTRLSMKVIHLLIFENRQRYLHIKEFYIAGNRKGCLLDLEKVELFSFPMYEQSLFHTLHWGF